MTSNLQKIFIVAFISAVAVGAIFLDFLTLAAFLGLGMLIWDCVEVGRNDAVNLVNAVYGARAMKRNLAILLAGTAVILGATFSSPVMETARKGIFDPTILTLKMAIAIYISVYFVDTVLLYGFSGFGMPVSTTACLVFELVGAAWFLAGFSNVNWPKVRTVIMGIIVSIIVSGISSFMVMRVFRGAIREKSRGRSAVMLHGPWIAGAMLTFLCWFMIFKGLKNVNIVKQIKAETFQEYGEALVLLLMWGGFTLVTHMFLVATNRYKTYRYLFHATAVLGMICMAFAFGQNDLANCASPGLSSLWLWRHQGIGTEFASGIAIPVWALFGCGALMASGMFTNYAQRVTRAAVNTGSQFDHVALYAPKWCRAIARGLMNIRGNYKPLAPKPARTTTGQKIHFDTLRASVIMGISASVIAFASGRGLPVSTTYVAFAAVLGTGISDRVFQSGDADRKIGRAIWVITCWFLAPVIAVVGTGFIALLVHSFAAAGLVACVFINLGARMFFKWRANQHEERFHKQAVKLIKEREKAERKAKKAKKAEKAADSGAESGQSTEPEESDGTDESEYSDEESDDFHEYEESDEGEVADDDDDNDDDDEEPDSKDGKR